MTDVAPSPAYKASSPGRHAAGESAGDAQLPKYTAPSTFSIGDTVTEPLVGLPEIKGHLALLHAFAELKKQVGSADTSNVSYVPENKEQKWAWFVGLAVER